MSYKILKFNRYFCKNAAVKNNNKINIRLKCVYLAILKTSLKIVFG